MVAQDEGQTENEDDMLMLYLREWNRRPRLSAGVERSLLRRGRRGDGEALRRVIESYLYRAATIAIERAPSEVRRSDAIQAANTVLIRLVEDRTIQEPGSVLETAIEQLWEE